jgi:hypothetical protein
VTEGQFTRENLKRYAVVVLLKIQTMSDAQAAALKQYVREGGRVVVIGPAPESDEKGRKKEPPALDDLLDKKVEGKEFTAKRTGSGATAYAEALPPHGARLADWIAKDLALSVVVSPATPILAKVRVNAFAEPGGKRYVVHFVNYNVPLGVEAKEPEVLAPIDVALRLPTGAEGVKLTCYDPEGEAADLPAKAEGKLLRFTLPSLRVYKVVEIRSSEPRP